VRSFTVEAIVLRRRPLGESDRILTLFSRERGKSSAVAKGARKTQSKFGARLDLFSRARITLHTGRSLDVITSASSIGGGWERLVDPDVFAFASYLAESIDGLCEPGLAVPELFDVVAEARDALAAGLRPGAIAAAVDLRILAVLGVGIELDACARCGQPLGRRPLAGGLATLSPAAGGLVCRRCLQAAIQEHDRADDANVRVSASELAALRAIGAIPFKELADHEALEPLARATHAFVQFHAGRRSRSLLATASRT